MRATWFLVALGASACADPAIEMTLQMPATQPAGYDLSCVTAVQVSVDGLNTGNGPTSSGLPDANFDCVDLTAALTKWSDIRTQIAGQFDINLPSSGLLGVELRGIAGHCDDQNSEHEAIFYGGAPYVDGQDNLTIPLAANISCDKHASYTVRPLDLLALETTHACAKPADTDHLVYAGSIRPRLLGDDMPLMVFENGASAGKMTADGIALLDSYSTTAGKSCIAVGYDSPGNLAGSCVNSTAPTLCGKFGEIELPVIDSIYAGSSIDTTLVTSYGEPVFGAAWEASPATTTTKAALTGATVTLEDPTQGTIVYVQRGTNKLVAMPNATATGSDGMFIAYIKGGPTAITVKATGHRDQRLIIGSTGDLPPTVLAVLPTL